MVNRLLALLTIVGGIIFSGCNAEPTFQELVGTYSTQYSFGADELTLRSDSTYDHVFTWFRDQATRVSKGRWKLDGGMVHMYDWVVVLRQVDRPEGDTVLSTTASHAALRLEQTFFGRMRIQVSENADQFYEKKQ